MVEREFGSFVRFHLQVEYVFDRLFEIDSTLGSKQLQDIAACCF